MKTKFGTNLKDLRTQIKWSQSTLAQTLGVDQRTISAWENEIAQPDFDTLIKLKELFDVAYEDLLE